MAVKMTGLVKRAGAVSGVGAKAKLMDALSRNDRWAAQGLLAGCSKEELNELLLSAAAGGDSWLAEEVLTQGADVNAKDPEGRTALMASLERSTVFGLSMFDLLIESGADITALDGEGNTVLRWAPGVDFIRSRVESELERALRTRLEVSVERAGGQAKRGPGSV